MKLRSKILLPISIASMFMVVSPLRKVDASSLVGDASSIIIGSSDEPLTEQDLLDAINWNEQCEELIINNQYDYSNEIGIYYYTVQGYNGTETKTISNTIEVRDTTAPQGVSVPITIGNNQKTLSEQDLLNGITASDNSKDTLILEIVSNSYKETKIPGTYEYQVKISDTSGNELIVSNQVIVFDKTAPIIQGADIITTGHKLSDEEILSQYLITDDYTSKNDLTITIEDKTVNKVGTYSLLITASDLDGNVATKSVSIKFIDDNTNAFYVANKVVINNLNQMNLTSLTQASAYILNIDSTKITSISSSYLQTPGVVGTYEVQVISEGTTFKYSIDVVNQTPAPTKKKENGFVRFFKWIYKHILTPIGHFFRWIWKNIIVKIGHFFRWLWKLIF